jgi:hypothetical protein
MNQTTPPDEVRETGCAIVVIGAAIAFTILAYMTKFYFAL